MEESNEGYRWTILFLTISVALVMTGFGIIFPILPKVLKQFDQGAFELGIIASFYGLFYVIFSPILGYFADKVGRKRIITIGLIGFSLSNLIYVVADSFWLLIVARSVEGIFSAGILPAAIAMAADIVPEDKRAQNIGYITAGNAIGFVIGPVLGGFLFEISLYTPFYASSIIAFLAYIWAKFQLPNDAPENITFEELDPVDNVEERLSKFANLLNKLPTPLYIFSIFIIVDMASGMAWLLVEPGFSFYIYDELQLEPRDFGTFIAAYGLFVAIGQSFLGSISDKIGRRPVIFLGLLFNIFFYSALFYAQTRLHLILSAILAGVGVGFTVPALKALLTDATHEAYRGTALGLESGLRSISQIVGPIVGGYLYDIYSMQFLMIISVTICGLGALLSITLVFDTPKKSEINVEKEIKENIETSTAIGSE